MKGVPNIWLKVQRAAEEAFGQDVVNAVVAQVLTNNFTQPHPDLRVLKKASDLRDVAPLLGRGHGAAALERVCALTHIVEVTLVEGDLHARVLQSEERTEYMRGLLRNEAPVVDEGMVVLLAWADIESSNEAKVPAGRYYLHVRAADAVAFEAGEDVPVFIKLFDDSYHEIGVAHEDGKEK